MQEAQHLALLEANHSFPCAYTFRVIAAGEHEGELTRSRLEQLFALMAADLLELIETPSSKGTYSSFRVTAQVLNAQMVLDLNRQLGALPGLRALL
jgi:putative lipoic acid-binding regulatory protein